MTEYPNGTVFKLLENGKPQHWKITGTRPAYPSGYMGESYWVIRCSPTGKEFRETNGFDKQWISDEVAKCNVRILMTSAVGEKAAIDNGIETGNKKRRILFLQKRILAMTMELSKLESGA